MKKILLILTAALMLTTAAGAQEVSEKKEIAVFALNYYDWSVPSGALGMVDQQIVSVFNKLGRFNIKGMSYRLSADSVDAFAEYIRKANESNLVVDEKYRLGEETFTEAEFQRLTGSFIIVIPVLTYYESTVSGDGTEWEVQLQTSFTFISVKDSGTIAHFLVDTYGNGDSQREAAQEASSSIATQLDYEIRSIEEFRLKTGILEVMPGGRVIIELGSDMGIMKGDEFSVINPRQLSSGHTVNEVSGLVVVSEVQPEVSYGRLLYGGKSVFPGDQLTEIPRFGADASVYVRGMFDIIGDVEFSGAAVGVRTSASRGFYGLRPVVGLEVPVGVGTANNYWPGLPLSVYGGGEFMWYFGRLQIEPNISLGATGLVPIQDDEQFYLTHVGGTMGLAVNWMVSDNMRIFAEGGYTYWFSLVPDILTQVQSFGGIFGGLGVTFKL